MYAGPTTLAWFAPCMRMMPNPAKSWRVSEQPNEHAAAWMIDPGRRLRCRF